ncbi:hypothetical protein [Natronoflexus pectinivorans]|uniref:Uncharacterized protein n=1 Tax=Natronoflexus pectinivorans TaxID=682526 RepID=A0A4R2GGX0_9BACT|nr:hypothetical protein [Natronoflexus pectinivorans]TCO07626.1 hypothetical protein EV194_10710 [Natronoflexus pectinivorans]
MKKHYVVSCFFVILAFTSCKKDSDSEYLPSFEGITIRDNGYDLPIENDPDDWRLDVEFSQIERNLFDTIDFNNIASVEEAVVEEVTGSIPAIIKCPKPVFYPNPVNHYGYISHNAGDIVNIVVVNKSFQRLFEFRGDSFRVMRIDFSDFPEGFYRLYYVFQNLEYEITGMGYGDVSVGMFDLFYGDM